MRTAARAISRLGCIGGLLFGLLVVLALYALMVPWSFHMGGRWTPRTMWSGVGRLRDSTGAQYGLYVSFYPNLRRGGVTRLGNLPWPRINLRGKSQACTAGGAKYQFNTDGTIYGAWADTDGKEVHLSLSETGNQRPRRSFRLWGVWHGPDLPMDDQKSMFMYFKPDGNLTPATSYTSPVPEKYAHVTLSWGTQSDFDHLCASLR